MLVRVQTSYVFQKHCETRKSEVQQEGHICDPTLGAGDAEI